MGGKGDEVWVSEGRGIKVRSRGEGGEEWVGEGCEVKEVRSGG